MAGEVADCSEDGCEEETECCSSDALSVEDTGRTSVNVVAGDADADASAFAVAVAGGVAVDAVVSDDDGETGGSDTLLSMAEESGLYSDVMAGETVAWPDVFFKFSSTGFRMARASDTDGCDWLMAEGVKRHGRCLLQLPVV